MQKLFEKLLRKSYYERNINGLCNEKLHYIYIQQLPTLRLKT